MAQIREIKATGTKKTENRFKVTLYLRVTPEGTLLPLDKTQRRGAQYRVSLELEYPSYEDEMVIKQEATRYDEQRYTHFVDYDKATEGRIRKSLVSWDLHEKVEGLTIKLHRIRGQLDDESLEAWKTLPPLVRKAIGALVNERLGVI